MVRALVWLRMPADIFFGVGGLALALMVARLWLRPASALDTLPAHGGVVPAKGS